MSNLPCPFCGETPLQSIEDGGSPLGYAVIRCENEDCVELAISKKITDIFPKERAFAYVCSKWNKRSTPPVADDPAGFSEVITWRPIEEAKKDGTRYLMYHRNDKIEIGHWSERCETWVILSELFISPTHFAELPKGPAIDEAIHAARKGV